MSKPLEPLFSHIRSGFPKAHAQIEKDHLISPHLFSPFVLELPWGLMDQVKEIIKHIYEIKESASYQAQLPLPEDFKTWPQNPSLLTCFDFHFSEEMGLKLIEINTNASLYLPMTLQRAAQIGPVNEDLPHPYESLHRSFIHAFELKEGDSLSIFDKTPLKEGLYFEFLIFKEWLSQKGYHVNIVSLEDFEKKAHHKIYNRSTDFYFSEKTSSFMRDQYLSKQRLFSPHPREYFLMADKKRLKLFRQELEAQDSPLASLIPDTKLFSDFESPEELWKKRKSHFFKPSSSFGGQGAFAGKSISRKTFAHIQAPDFIAQEFCPPGRRLFQWEGEDYEMKYDLRFFAFQGEVQNYGARLYQGQTTNMKTPMGGVAPILFV